MSNGPPPKSWEQAGSPFRPPSHGSTSDVVEASGTAKPGEIVSTSNNINRKLTKKTKNIINRNSLGRPLPPRPWEQNHLNSSYGGYYANYNSGYGSGTYGNKMYRGVYGGHYGSSGMYGGGMYNRGYGGPVGGYGLGGGPKRAQDPNNSIGAPSSPPGFWISFLRMMESVVNIFGRYALLVDQNTQAIHMFLTSLLQVFDRGGLLYGELARFVFRLLGIRTKPKKIDPQGQNALPKPVIDNHNERTIATRSSSWDKVWENDTKK